MKMSVLNRRSAIGVVAAGLSFLSFSAAYAATTITVWCWDKNFNGATMKEAGERYTKTHPDVTLNIVDFAKADLEQKLQAQLASGTTDGLPDIVLIEDYGAQKYLQSFPGAFEPLQTPANRLHSLCPIQGGARHRRRQDLFAALRLRRFRPLLSFRLSRGSWLQSRRSARHHLGQAH